MAERKAVVVGISGCSSSGKTTLARLLRDIFPSTFVLHEDDFYKPENELPVRDGLADWDCAEALSLPDMERSLAHIRSTGTLPPDLDSKEDRNSVGHRPVTDLKIEDMKTAVRAWLQPGQPGHAVFEGARLRVCLLDGFLLYSPEMASVAKSIDVKLLLLVSRATATRRREARDGYVTLEGFWKDPPGYVDKIVWPNYVAAHKGLFEGGDVEGRLDQQVLKEMGILVPVLHAGDTDMGSTLEWAVKTLMGELPRFC